MAGHWLANGASSSYELAAIEYCAVSAMRRLLEEPVTSHTHTYLQTVLSAIADLLPSRFAFEEEGNWMDVEEAFPEEHAEILHHRIERAILYEDLRELRQALDNIGTDPAEYLDWNERALSWLERLTTHEEADDRLRHLMVRLHHSQKQDRCFIKA